MQYTVYYTKPTDFEMHVEASGCYLWCNNRLLLLKRHHDKPQGGTWGVPGGKLEPQETPKEAVIREIHEEIGVDISQGVSYINTLYVALPHVSYGFHMYYKRYDTYPKLSLQLEENVEARWVECNEALMLPLVTAGKEALDLFQVHVSKSC